MKMLIFYIEEKCEKKSTYLIKFRNINFHRNKFKEEIGVQFLIGMISD
jgi:hypothetical protein